MKKKVKIIIISSVLAILGIVYSVFYILDAEATKKVSADVIDYICNKPLPVIGLTILGLGILIIRILAETGIGKKTLKECKESLAETKEDLRKSNEEKEALRQELLEFKKEIKQDIQDFKDEHKDELREICSHIPNKKVKELGERFYGTKEENSVSVE